MSSENAKALLKYVKAVLINENLEDDIPELFNHDDDFDELNEIMLAIRNFSLALAKGDLSEDVQGNGIILKSLETFQQRFKALEINAYDRVPRNFFTGTETVFDLNNIFDSMSKQIEYSTVIINEVYRNFEMIFCNIPDPALVISMDEKKVVASNQMFLEMSGLTEKEVINEVSSNLQLEIIDERFMKKHKNFDPQLFYNNIETVYRNKQDKILFWNASLKVISIDGINYLLMVIRDVTDVKKLEQKLIESESRYRLLVDNASDIISTVNLEGDFTYISPSVEKITGYTVEEVKNKYLEINYFSPKMLKKMEKILKCANEQIMSDQYFEPIHLEELQYRKDGSVFWSDTILSGIYDDENQLKGLMGVTRDITEKVKLQDEIIKLSETDKLTQLYNRLKLDDVLDSEFIRAKQNRGKFAVILLDIDYFKETNDKYGHQVGDKVLIELAKLFRASIRATDSVGRWGGEEFVFILPDTDKAGAMQLAEKIRIRIREKIFIKQIRMTGSLGVAVYHGDSSVNVMMSRADKAMYVAKKKGRDQVQFI
ncbi:diguanylate cyclase [Acetobacterium woodii]|uniref:Diguanylate cyclase n=1 Tax=Acetobacterium woodii (strain ATCC 29683 / DSM 1030 / JCM 2381 / KCTC 1655 / WB1) TaxID=931626 RepID=H6LH53_ACEWD|nr:diguanylate cyclase [Acetobacterium woodii]AFA48391.1 hypothetical protein containing diguanylate cyclase domain [Acetobacterium woodii DSM 1030]